jgi:hypothetical protein
VTLDATRPNPMHEQLKAIAAEYRKWGRVDDYLRWAPFLCIAPAPSRARFSQSDDSVTHGRKLYFIYAHKRNEYMGMMDLASASIGQVIVKESWIPVACDSPDPAALEGSARESYAGARLEHDSDGNVNHYAPYIRRDAQWYRAGDKGPLFIMMKTERGPHTDDGWIYATLTPDGSEVTAAGRIESCMKCHQDAPFDRLFGMSLPFKPVKARPDSPGISFENMP